MLYKGGPQNYSKGDWQIVGGIVGTMMLLLFFGAIFGESKPSRTTSRSVSSAVSAPAASSEFVEGARQAGYSGAEAEQIAEAAERLCTSTGEC
jgi:hypothetical protein